MRAITEWNRRLFDLGSRPAGGAPTALDANELVASCVALARRHAQLRNREITFEGAPAPARIVASEQLVRRAVLNLVLNAGEATDRGGRIAVGVALPAPGTVCITVDDSGRGPAEMRAKILELFFTTKPEGTGLGLASVVACAEFHHGSLRIEEAPLGGARFALTLGAGKGRATGQGRRPTSRVSPWFVR